MFDYTVMQGLYTAEQTRALDRRAIEGEGIPGTVLMSRAADAAWRALCRHWPAPSRVQVLCGTGNNGGDGFLLAAIASRRGVPVTVWQVGDPDRVGGDARSARQQALDEGVPVETYTPGSLLPEGVLVDALLGTGLGGEVRDGARRAIEEVNGLGIPVLAVDVPSGLCADTGRELGLAVRASVTVTFIARKRGLYTLEGPDCRGELVFDDLSVPPAVYASAPPDCRLLDVEAMLAALPPRAAAAHKGQFGRVLIAGGERGMGGAVALAAEAALRCGAGLVSAATRAEHVAPVLARTPEVMVHAVESGQELTSLIAAADVVAIGPGLGQQPWGEQLCQAALGSPGTRVVDADALNLLARGAGGVPRQRADWVLSPHPGEAARLLDCPAAAVQADRFAAVRRLQDCYRGVVLLKGNGTLVCGDGQLLLCEHGNPGMASGGMGDALTGVIASLLAQGLSLLDAAALGAGLHAVAADRAALEGQRGLVASDLAPFLRQMLR